MLKNKQRKILRIILSAAFIAVVFIAVSGAKEAYALKSRDDEGGFSGSLRIGYCQDADYYEFDYEMYQIGMGLVNDGYINCAQLSKLGQGDSARDVWKALSLAKSDYFVFADEAYIDIASDEFSGLSEEEMLKKLKNIIESEDIDLMITMGTSAGCAVRDACDVPYMNFIASDPIESQITSGEEFSGSDRAWAHVSTGIEEKALNVMYDIFGAKKVGIVYNDDPEAYIYSGAASVDKFAEEKGIDVVRKYVVDFDDYSDEEYKRYKSDLLKAHKELAKSGLDLYILTTCGLESGDFYESLEPFMENGIPVFSINSTEDVRFGALAAVEMFDYESIGRFASANLMDYHEGTPLSKISQIYETAPFLVLNSDTMHKTGIKLSLDTLLSTSSIYRKYEGE